MAQPIEVFFSYSRVDKLLRDKLETHLSGLRQIGVIRSWHDREIGAGAEWAKEIDHHLQTADVILLLISPDFVASGYCYGIELQRAMERHEANEACVIPIMLRPTAAWKRLPFAKLQIYPRGAEPITQWADQDMAFVNVAEGIEAAVERLLAHRQEQQQEEARLAEQAGRAEQVRKEKSQDQQVPIEEPNVSEALLPTKLTIQVRTAESLLNLLRVNRSGNWVVSRGKEQKITHVEIVSFDGTQKIEATFDTENSFRLDDNRLIIAFKNARILNCNISFNKRRNPVRYFYD
jgi:TIR domain